MVDRRMKVIMDDGSGMDRVFVAAGETVRYKRDTFEDMRPRSVGQRWGVKRTTVHTLTWETVTYE